MGTEPESTPSGELEAEIALLYRELLDLRQDVGLLLERSERAELAIEHGLKELRERLASSSLGKFLGL